MADAMIPPPIEADMNINLAFFYHRVDGPVEAGVIRRCHAAEAENARLRSEKQFLEEKGIRVGSLKTSDKAEPYLAYVIREGSELDDMPTLNRVLDAEQRIAALEAALATARAEIAERDRIDAIHCQCGCDDCPNCSARVARLQAAMSSDALPPTESAS